MTPKIELDHGNYNKALQKCVADGMLIHLDEVRCARNIMAILQGIEGVV